MATVVLFDPNIWISCAWNNDYTIFEQAIAQEIIFASSPRALHEIINVLQRKKFVRRISLQHQQEILALYHLVTTEHTPVFTFTTAPDIKDNYLFDICREARVLYFVTGDKALLRMKQVQFDTHLTEIISLNHFREILQTL